MKIKTVKDMKEQILKVAQDLEKNIITDIEAQNLLLVLFGVIKSVCEHDYEKITKYGYKCKKCDKTGFTPIHG